MSKEKKSVDSLNLMSPDVLTPTLENSNLYLFAVFVTESLAHHPIQDALDTYSLSFLMKETKVCSLKKKKKRLFY